MEKKVTIEQIKKAWEEEIKSLEEKLKTCQEKENCHILDKKIQSEIMYEGMEAAYRDSLRDLRKLYETFFG